MSGELLDARGSKFVVESIGAGPMGAGNYADLEKEPDPFGDLHGFTEQSSAQQCGRSEEGRVMRERLSPFGKSAFGCGCEDKTGQKHMFWRDKSVGIGRVGMRMLDRKRARTVSA
jgi:hypothetical protein